MQTTTEVMAETIREFNPHVAVFPNQIARLPRGGLGRSTALHLAPADSSSSAPSTGKRTGRLIMHGA